MKWVGNFTGRQERHGLDDRFFYLENALKAKERLKTGEYLALPIRHLNPQGGSCDGRLVTEFPDWNAALVSIGISGSIESRCSSCGRVPTINENQQIAGYLK